MCARGGYGCHRLIDRLDATAFREASKPLVGYSDITTLLLWQRKQAGLLGIHGPMCEKPEPSTARPGRRSCALCRERGRTRAIRARLSVNGWGEGRLVGGSLSVCVASLGTPWELDTRDAIVMLEDVTELPYRIDRMLQQLRAAGKFDRAVGIALGHFTDCDDERYPEWTVERLFDEVFGALGIPVVADCPLGMAPKIDPGPSPGARRSTVRGVNSRYWNRRSRRGSVPATGGRSG